MTNALYPSTAAASVLCAALVYSAPSEGQVRYFDHVPTPQEIQQSLGMPVPLVRAWRSAGGSRRTKGIEWTRPADPVASPSDHALALPVNFELGAARVSKSSLAYVEAVADVLASHPDIKLTVEGHTDGTGDSKANFVLSWERSLAVFRLMVYRYGIDPARLQPVGKGASEPLQDADPAHGINRRVQFRMIG